MSAPKTVKGQALKEQRAAIMAEIGKLEQRFGVRAVTSAFNRHTMVRRKRAQLQRAEASIQAEIRRLQD